MKLILNEIDRCIYQELIKEIHYKDGFLLIDKNIKLDVSTIIGRNKALDYLMSLNKKDLK